MAAKVRGPGTFIGVEVGSKTLASRIAEAMRSRGVLIGRTGPDDEVLKIRPPLVFDHEHARELLEAFSETLAVIGRA